MKNIWKNNKVVLMLVSILVICFIAICFVVFTYFFGGNSSVYGDRLDGIKEYKLSDNYISSIKSKLKEDEKIDSTSINSKGKIVYIHLNFVDDITLEEAKSKATEVLNEFKEKYLEYYDFNFVLSADETENSDGFTILGAQNKNVEKIVWNNNTPIEKDSEESE